MDILEGGREVVYFLKNFVWNSVCEAWWGRVMTSEQLKRRGFSPDTRCYLCKDMRKILGTCLFIAQVDGQSGLLF